MKKVLRVVLYILGGLLVVVVALVAIVVYSMRSSGHPFAATKRDLPIYVAGRWDWSTRKHPCTDSAHVISFGADGRTMEIRQEHAAPGPNNGSAVYDILAVTPTRIRGAIRGEKRLTDAGKPVVWDLVMFKVDEYHWHRTDWSRWGYTPAVIRCVAPPA